MLGVAVTLIRRTLYSSKWRRRGTKSIFIAPLSVYTNDSLEIVTITRTTFVRPSVFAAFTFSPLLLHSWKSAPFGRTILILSIGCVSTLS